MPLTVKVISITLNERLFEILNLYGTKDQYGGTPKVGCRDGIFALKTLLHQQCNHNQQSFVAFVDLVKALQYKV